MTQQESYELISKKLEQAKNLINEAVSISEQHGVVFTLPWGGEGTSEAGLGATYVPTTASEKDKEWNSNWNSWRNYGWMPSAGSC
jgi:hypothetical protein